MEPFLGQLMDIGRYRLTHKVGSGGMATVYLAEDVGLQTKVVIKKNSNSKIRAERDQFVAEARIMVQISENPQRPTSLPMVRSYFVDPDGEQYLVMQYIEGEDLSSMVRRVGALDEKVVLYWLAQLLDAIEFLHQQIPPIIHCDIKPDNIRISKDGKQAYLVDFGIINGLGGYGTPGYAPLEQHDRNLKVSIQSDIYALGATLYVLLSGIDPHTMPAATDLKNGSATLKPLGGSISNVMQSVVRKAMSLPQNTRYQTIDAMRQQLISSFPTALSLPSKQIPQVKPLDPLESLKKCSVQETAFWYANPQWGAVRCVLAYTPTMPLLPVQMVSVHDKRIKFWQISNWQQSGLFKRTPDSVVHGDDVIGVVVHKDGRSAATAGRDHKICLWDMTTRQVKPPTISVNSWVRALTFHPTAPWLVGIDDSQQLWRWSTRQARLGEHLANDINGRFVTYSPNGRWLVIVGEENQAWVRDEQDGTITHLTIPGSSPKEWLRTAVFRPDGQMLVAGGSDGFLHFFHTTDGKTNAELMPDQWVYQRLNSHQMGAIYAIAISPDGRFLTSTGHDKYLYVFNTAHGQLVSQPFPLEAAGLSLQFGANWQYLVLGMSNGRVSLLWLS